MVSKNETYVIDQDWIPVFGNRSRQDAYRPPLMPPVKSRLFDAVVETIRACCSDGRAGRGKDPSRNSLLVQCGPS
jgi:hypothetical protein